jgi:hypothetical protein
VSTISIAARNLTGSALRWAVASIEHPKAHLWLSPNGELVVGFDGRHAYRPDTDPSTAWPIIHRELIEIAPTYSDDGKTAKGWTAMMFNDERCEHQLVMAEGADGLVAAMRCHVASARGEFIDVPTGFA